MRRPEAAAAARALPPTLLPPLKLLPQAVQAALVLLPTTPLLLWLLHHLGSGSEARRLRAREGVTLRN